MNGKLKISLAALLLICLAVFGTSCTRAVIIEENKTFSAVVLEKGTNSVQVEPLEGEDERKCSDKIDVFLNEGDSAVLEEIQVGDTVEITYDGTIAESYPAQITGTKGMKVIK